jgi:hypothetical protein
MAAPGVSAVAGTACVVAASSAFVMIGAGVTAIDATGAFDAFLNVHNADAIATGALHHVDRCTHLFASLLRDRLLALGLEFRQVAADFVRCAGGSCRSLMGSECAPGRAAASNQ